MSYHDEDERETCCKRECDKYAVIVMKVYTDNGVQFMSFCSKHLSTASEVCAELASAFK